MIEEPVGKPNWRSTSLCSRPRMTLLGRAVSGWPSESLALRVSPIIKDLADVAYWELGTMSQLTHLLDTAAGALELFTGVEPGSGQILSILSFQIFLKISLKIGKIQAEKHGSAFGKCSGTGWTRAVEEQALSQEPENTLQSLEFSRIQLLWLDQHCLFST